MRKIQGSILQIKKPKIQKKVRKGFKQIGYFYIYVIGQNPGTPNSLAESAELIIDENPQEPSIHNQTSASSSQNETVSNNLL